MNKVAIAFTTRDRTELSKQSIEPLQPIGFDLFVIDGSKTAAGIEFAKTLSSGDANLYGNVTGGADAAIVFSLTAMLNHLAEYEYVGLVENDVLLDKDWYEPTMALFEKGREDGLEVGAVSARSYEDRILIQGDGYAVMHNLGAGMVIFSRKAAELVLRYFRTGNTIENRRAFMQLSGLDIARWNLFTRDSHPCCADWCFDKVLAQHGVASLALTPSKCAMIGQVPSLEEQGLALTTGPVEERRDDVAFEKFAATTALIRDGHLRLPVSIFQPGESSDYMIFPHQIEMLGGGYEGDWSLKWNQGFGPFSWKAGEHTHRPALEGWTALGEGGPVFGIEEWRPTANIPVSGPCTLLVSGGEKGGKVQVTDEGSGFDMTLDLVPEGELQQVMQVQVPAGVSYRNIRLTALSPGIVFYGLQAREPQPFLPDVSFNHSMLAKP